MSIYVVTNLEHEHRDQYKLGRTKTSKKKIESMYQRYLNCAKVLLYYSTSDYIELDKKIKLAKIYLQIEQEKTKRKTMKKRN